MYVVFKLTPFSRNITRVPDEGTRFENLVAASLLKVVHYREYGLGENWDLHFISKKGDREIDFFITKNRSPLKMIEVKLS